MEGGALKGLHLSISECVKQSHLSFQQGRAGSRSTRFLHSRLSRSCSSCPSVSWVNGLLLASHNGTAAALPSCSSFSQTYFVLAAMSSSWDTSAGFWGGLRFRKAHLFVMGLGYLRPPSSRAQPLLAHYLSIPCNVYPAASGWSGSRPVSCTTGSRKRGERDGKGSEELMDELASLHCLHFPQQVQITETLLVASPLFFPPNPNTFWTLLAHFYLGIFRHGKGFIAANLEVLH